MRERDTIYKPELGWFISEDTYKGTLSNPQSQKGYAYVENNPLIYTDPSGNTPHDKLNEFLENFIEDDNFTKNDLATTIIKYNIGDKEIDDINDSDIYNSFHDIVQVIAAQRIYAEAGYKGDYPVLEYKIKTSWFSTVYADIVFGNKVWEVKRLSDKAIEDASAQLNKYVEETKDSDNPLTRGGYFSAESGITLAKNLYMQFEYLAEGRITYAFYQINKNNEKQSVTIVGAMEHVKKEYAKPDDPDKIKKPKPKPKPKIPGRRR
jgi:hypothetical protein